LTSTSFGFDISGADTARSLGMLGWRGHVTNHVAWSRARNDEAGVMSDAAGIVATVLSYLWEPPAHKKARTEEFIVTLRAAQARHMSIVTTNANIHESFYREYERASYDHKETMARRGQPEPMSPYVDCEALCDRLRLHYPWLVEEIERLRAAAAKSGDNLYEVNSEFCSACSTVIQGLLLGRWGHWLASRPSKRHELSQTR
jgi:hypothetical protein